MRRQGILAILVALSMLTVAIPDPAGAGDGQPNWPTYDPSSPSGVPGGEIDPKIETIVRPLATAPAILEEDQALRVEIDPGELGPAATPTEVDAWLTPSFGAAQAQIELALTDAETGVESQLWPDRTITALTFELPHPGSTEALVEGLHDLTLAWGPGPTETDTQPRAVELVDRFPGEPEIVVLSDPSVGDPRPVQEGAGDAQDGDVGSLTAKTLRTAGVPTMDEGRWAALRKAITEINLLDPDLVLLTGDLTFGVYPRLLPYEYEEAYEVLNEIRVPTFATPGNHDLYTFDARDRPNLWDGHELWPKYFGPWHYSTDLPGGLHLVSLNTFDWDQFGRIPFQPPDGETRSGGQVGEDQLAWLAEDLVTARAKDPDVHIVTMAHHDPSWQEARHPWPGDNRLVLRDLLNASDVAAHFSGHKHNDRVARYFQGDVVETIGQAGGPERKLHHVRRDDSIAHGHSQDELGSILRDPSYGTVFFTTTTAASGLKGPDWGQGGYWGYRLGTLDWMDGGIDPADLGYPASRTFLDRHAERPDRWNESHAEYGQFSYPSFRLNRTLDGPNDGTTRQVTMHLDNDLAVGVDLTVPISLRAGDRSQVTVEGGEVVQTRTDGTYTDLWVAVDLGSGDEVTVHAEGPGLVPFVPR